MSQLSTTPGGFRYGGTTPHRVDVPEKRDTPGPISTFSALQRKDAERQAIADDIAAFERRQGRIEVLPGVGVKR